MLAWALQHVAARAGRPQQARCACLDGQYLVCARPRLHRSLTPVHCQPPCCLPHTAWPPRRPACARVWQEYNLCDESRLHVVDMRQPFQLGPFECEAARVTHSIPDCCAIVLRCEHGTIVHTGDWKIDEDPLDGRKFDRDLFEQLGGWWRQRRAGRVTGLVVGWTHRRGAAHGAYMVCLPPAGCVHAAAAWRMAQSWPCSNLAAARWPPLLVSAAPPIPRPALLALQGARA